MASILPTNNVVIREIKPNMVSHTQNEYAWDFNSDTFILENGNPKMVSGLEAIRVWIYKSIKTQRYIFLAYTDDFGCEIEELLSSGYSQAAMQTEAERMMKECLLIHPDILSITNFTLEKISKGFEITFVANTVYGSTTMKV